MSEEAPKPFVKPPLQVKGSWRSQTVKGRRMSSTVPGDLVAVAAIGLPETEANDEVPALPTEVPFSKTSSAASGTSDGFVKPPLQLKGSWKGDSAKSQSFKRSASGKAGMSDDIARALSAVRQEEEAAAAAAAGKPVPESAAPAPAPVGEFKKPPLQLKGSWRGDSMKSQSFKRSASGKDAFSDAAKQAQAMIEKEEADKAAGNVPEGEAKEDKPFVKPPLQAKGSWRSQSVKGRRLSATVPTEMFQLASAEPPVPVAGTAAQV